MSTYGYKLRDSAYRPETEKVSAEFAAQDAAAAATARENANKAAHATAAAANDAKKVEATTTRESFEYAHPQMAWGTNGQLLLGRPFHHAVANSKKKK